MKKTKYIIKKSILVGFGFIIALPLILSLSSVSALAGSCDQARSMANDVRAVWDSYQNGGVSRKSYDRTYARFMRMKKRCLASRAVNSNKAVNSKIDGKSINERGEYSFTVYVASNGKRTEGYAVRIDRYYYIVVSGSTYFSRRGGPGRRLMNDACYEFNSKPRPVPLPVFNNNHNINVCGQYSSKHVYRSNPFMPNRALQFWIYDTEYSDNSGNLRVDVYELGKGLNSDSKKSRRPRKQKKPRNPGINLFGHTSPPAN